MGPVRPASTSIDPAVRGHLAPPTLPPRRALAGAARLKGMFKALLHPWGAIPRSASPARRPTHAPVAHPATSGTDARASRSEQGGDDGLPPGDGADVDPLDPWVRRRAQLAPPMSMPVAPPPPQPIRQAGEVLAPVRAASLEELLPQLVRRVAWSSSDGGRGTVRLEVGAGALAGAVLTVHADQGAVRVHLATSSGADTRGWRERIEKRLRARGLDVAEVEVS